MRGEQPDLNDPICLRQGATIETVCHGIHRSLASHFKSVKWRLTETFCKQSDDDLSGMLWFGASQVSSIRSHRKWVSIT